MKKKLNEIISCPYDLMISGIADDSRLVKEGYLFVATKGFNVDHFDYIDMAISNGAVAIIVDREVEVGVPAVVVSDVNDLFPILCQRFYDINPNEFKLIGITGTDGKTTSATLVRQLLLPDYNIAYIGTNGVDVSNEHFNTSNTTPCISELYECLYKIKQFDCKTVVMEVSSEALLHKRVAGLKFDIVAFTNITEDHLNIHKTIENYRNSKFSLVNYLNDGGVAFVNGDDENCRKLTCDKMSTFGFDSKNNFTIFDVNYGTDYTDFKIKSNEKIYSISCPMLGKYNVYNVTLAFLIGLRFKISVEVLIDRIKNIKTIVGRREKINFGQNYDIILDYAHTLNGISCILDSVVNYKKIITVTGAAGGREKEKRVKIGKVVLEKSDLVIFTMDDPRYESVDQIIDDMIGDYKGTNFLRINDRKQAIFKAFELAKAGDVVLVLGKGRDNYMAIEDKRIPYCDYDVICEFFSK